MRIKPLLQRVTYQNNPLAEVVCQLRFASLLLDDADTLALLESGLRELGYPLAMVEDVATVSLHVQVDNGTTESSQTTQKIRHFFSQDRAWKISLTNDFLAITCTQYNTWEEFSKRFVQVHGLMLGFLKLEKGLRIGLRYRDIIDRDVIGLSGVPWTELLSPFIIGPFSAMDLNAEGGAVPEADILSHAFQSVLSLEDCRVLLQGGVVHSPDGTRQAFMIDTDFFCEGPEAQNCLVDSKNFLDVIERLHKNAGAMFRALIREPLHNALRPRAL